MAPKRTGTGRKVCNGEATVVAVGDVVLSRAAPAEAFDRVLDELKAGDFSCCNVEAPLSDRGLPQYGKFETLRAAPEMIEGFVHGGFKVASLANNHTMDYGPEALLDTIALMDARGILHAGAGRNLQEARRPAFFQSGGMRFAFASFATEAYLGYGAHSQKPGIAVIRRDPLYGPACVNPDDLGMMKEVIREAKSRSDFVVAAFHWGLSQSRALTRSQTTLGRAAVDAGAGLVVGHHPHVLQAAEVYKRSLILYSLGNFVFDLMPKFLAPETRDTVLVKVRLRRCAVAEAIFMPAWINERGQPEFPAEGHAKGREILSQLHSLCAARKTGFHIKNGTGTVRVRRE